LSQLNGVTPESCSPESAGQQCARLRRARSLAKRRFVLAGGVVLSCAVDVIKPRCIVL
jgi:hypothetical protein